ncbi:MAG: hypothetical protein ACI8WB_002922 [Phenylobacterium sp.]|jgi:hypothetical protein
MKANDILILDTNVIIEAHRTGGLSAICGGFSIHCVEKVIEETQTGHQKRKPEFNINENLLRDKFTCIVTIDEDDVEDAMEDLEGFETIHAGEQHLISYIANSMIQNDNVWFVSSPDSAAMKVMVKAGWKDNIVSLEKAYNIIRFRPQKPLEDHFKTKWTSERITFHILN